MQVIAVLNQKAALGKPRLLLTLRGRCNLMVMMCCWSILTCRVRRETGPRYGRISRCP